MPYTLCGSCNYKRRRSREVNYKEKQKFYIKRWATRNSDIVKRKRKEYVEQNREKVRVYYRSKCARRRARKLSATPPWVDNKTMNLIYKNCPKGYHVDHIIPLNGINVSGLHVPWNLQYLPAIENLIKGNKV